MMEIINDNDKNMFNLYAYNMILLNVICGIMIKDMEVLG